MSPFRSLLALLAIISCASLVRAEDTGNVSLKEDSNNIAVSIDGKVLTQYWFGKREDRAYARPFFFPVLARDGALVTSDQYGRKEHPHHSSLWVGQGDVNGANHWALEGDKTPKQRHIKFEKVEGNTIVEDLEWEDTHHEPMLRERRTLRFLPIGQKEWAIDFQEEFTPINGPVTFMDTKEAGMVAVRMAKSISDKPAITTSAGVHGQGMPAEKQAWGKAADWCDESGQVNGKEYGVAVFDDPRNPRHPTRWHVRAYGLLAANPFGLHDFDKAPAHTGDMVMEPGKTVTFRYRVVIHEGDAQSAGLPALYEQYVKSAKE